MDEENNVLMLDQIARQAMTEKDLLFEFPIDIQEEVSGLKEPLKTAPAVSYRDLRDLLWISIDNEDTLDIDQLTFAEKTPFGTYKIYVAIADVEHLVKRFTAIDRQASYNTTSVYTPTLVFPMLPLRLSTELTSLQENADRSAIVVEIEVNDQGEYQLNNLYPAWVKNYAKLNYNNVANWFNQNAELDIQHHATSVAMQLQLQDEIAQLIKKKRYQQGYFSYSMIEVLPVIKGNTVIDLALSTHNRARAMIENIMIATNILLSNYFKERGISTIKRLILVPKRWDRIVELADEGGEQLPLKPDIIALKAFLSKQQHQPPQYYGHLISSILKLLGKGEYVVEDSKEPPFDFYDLNTRYAHMTAPNRRFSDLVLHRLLKHHLHGSDDHYSKDELEAIALHCTKKESDAMKVERTVRKSATAMIIKNRVGEQFDALVTGASHKGTWVKLLDPPIEGKVIEGHQGLDVGQLVRVQLINVDIQKGFIDFKKL